MKRKVLSLALSTVMVFGTVTGVFANGPATKDNDKKESGINGMKSDNKKTLIVKKVVGKDNKIQYVIDQKFVEGYGDGDYGYDKNIKRSEITKLLVYSNGDRDLAEKLQQTIKLYRDVNPSFWANGVISVGTTVPSKSNDEAMLNGFPDGEFKPEQNVTYAQLSKMLVVLVKKDLTDDMLKDANNHWAEKWMDWAKELGILEDVNVKDFNAPAKRSDAFTMLYNALYAMKEIKIEDFEAKLGILSNLTDNKLTINQNTNESYDVTKSTVYVGKNVGKYEIADVVKARKIKNPEQYVGTFVRVIVNDKNEITHILTLGTPSEGPVAGKTYQGQGLNISHNERWHGVSDSTVSTFMQYAGYLVNAKNADSYAEFKYVKDDVDKVSVYNKEVVNTVKDIKVNKNTEVFIDDKEKNILRRVKDINEALKLVSTDYKVNMFNVYIGYDNDGINNIARVIVLNLDYKGSSSGKTSIVNSAVPEFAVKLQGELKNDATKATNKKRSTHHKSGGSTVTSGESENKSENKEDNAKDNKSGNIQEIKPVIKSENTTEDKTDLKTINEPAKVLVKDKENLDDKKQTIIDAIKSANPFFKTVSYDTKSKEFKTTYKDDTNIDGKTPSFGLDKTVVEIKPELTEVVSKSKLTSTEIEVVRGKIKAKITDAKLNQEDFDITVNVNGTGSINVKEEKAKSLNISTTKLEYENTDLVKEKPFVNIEKTPTVNPSGNSDKVNGENPDIVIGNIDSKADVIQINNGEGKTVLTLEKSKEGTWTVNGNTDYTVEPSTANPESITLKKTGEGADVLSGDSVSGQDIVVVATNKKNVATINKEEPGITKSKKST